MTCCPCLIITIHLYSVQFYTAYFSDEVYFSKLCDIPLLPPSSSWHDGPRDEYSNTFKFQVIRKTVQQLRNAYAAVHTGSALPNAPHLFPQFAKLSPCPRPACPIILVDRVPATASQSDSILGRAPLLFTGFVQRDDGSLGPVHVKFTADRKYGADAHLLLAKYGLNDSESHADHGSDSESDADSGLDSGSASGESAQTSWRPLAPVFLHSYLFPGADTRMVYMETLAGNTLAHLLAAGAAVSEADLADVRTAVSVLHQHGFVHGDIRPSNVLMQRFAADDGSGGAYVRAYLLDFDWAGKVGKARYPNTLSEHVHWPRPARQLRGQLITKRHDLFMLKNLLRVWPQTGEASADDRYDDIEDEDEGEEGGETATAADPQADSGEVDNSPWSAILTREKVFDFGRSRPGVYPGDLNPRIKWPRPAEELHFQPITAAHDRFMFEDMREMLGLLRDDGSDTDED